jgi:hypothetical protein
MSFFNAFFPTLSFQLDLPLPMSRTDRGILPMEEVHVREQFPKYIGSVPGTGVLLQLEDGLRQTICTPYTWSPVKLQSALT